MTIEFATPNGNMKIYANTFFEQQTITKIRKMLKCYRDSYPEENKIQDLKNWLQKKVDEEKQNEATYSKQYEIELEKLPVMEGYYQYLKAFCDDKDKLNQAKQKAGSCKSHMRFYLSSMNKAARLSEKYKSILADTNTILT